MVVEVSLPPELGVLCKRVEMTVGGYGRAGSVVPRVARRGCVCILW